MEKSALFLDFDGFKFDTLKMHVEYINQKYSIQSISSDYINNPPLETVIKKYLPEDRHHEIVNATVYADTSINLLPSFEWHEQVQPMEGMCEVVPLLAKKYSLWTLTSREKGSLEVIQHLLNQHVPGCISNIQCLWEYLGDYKFKQVASKKEFISNFTGPKTAFLDDSANEVLETQDTITSYLFDPHGANDHLNTIKNRVRSWREIGEIFL